MARLAAITWRDEAEHRRLLAERVNGAINGQTNAAGSVTLTASSTTTVVADLRVGSDSVIVCMPKTATAAAAMTSLYISSRGEQTFTLAHDSTADTDRDYEYAIMGTGRG